MKDNLWNRVTRRMIAVQAEEERFRKLVVNARAL